MILCAGPRGQARADLGEVREAEAPRRVLRLVDRARQPPAGLEQHRREGALQLPRPGIAIEPVPNACQIGLATQDIMPSQIVTGTPSIRRNSR